MKYKIEEVSYSNWVAFERVWLFFWKEIPSTKSTLRIGCESKLRLYLSGNNYSGQLGN